MLTYFLLLFTITDSNDKFDATTITNINPRLFTNTQINP